MEVKMIDLKDIVTNPLQPRQTFDREKLQELADSIKEGELLQPIVVRTKGKKYEIVCGERRYKAFQILKEPKIPAIVRVIKDDTDALEKSTIENWHREDLTDHEKEKALGDLWKSNRYKTKKELAKKLGIPEYSLTRILEASEFREREKISMEISSRTIGATRPLETEVRKKLIKDIEQKKIKTSELDEIVSKVQEFEEPEQQMEILEEFEEQEEQSKEIFDNIIAKKREIAKGETEIEHFREKNADQIRADAIVELFEKASSFTSSYFKMIKSENEKERAIRYLKKIRDHINKVLIGLGETKVVDIDK